MASLLPGESDTNSAATLIDESVIVGFVLAPLHSLSISDLVMWTECELIQWIDAAVKKLARKFGLFVGRDESGVTAAGIPTYALPQPHVSTLHVSAMGSALRPSATAELAARDTSWYQRQGTPKRWYQDGLGVGVIGYSPVPEGIFSTVVIYYGWPQTVDCLKTHTTIPLPYSLEPYVELEVIASAYEKEGDGHAPDIASAARTIAGIYEKAAMEYWGAAQ